MKEDDDDDRKADDDDEELEELIVEEVAVEFDAMRVIIVLGVPERVPVVAF